LGTADIEYLLSLISERNPYLLASARLKIKGILRISTPKKESEYDETDSINSSSHIILSSIIGLSVPYPIQEETLTI
jgi:hypothetical protein